MKTIELVVGSFVVTFQGRLIDGKAMFTCDQYPELGLLTPKSVINCAAAIGAKAQIQRMLKR